MVSYDDSVYWLNLHWSIDEIVGFSIKGILSSGLVWTELRLSLGNFLGLLIQHDSLNKPEFKLLVIVAAILPIKTLN